MPDLKRMKQRRGNKSDLPILTEGELAITLDTKEIFYGLGNENINIHTDSLTVDNLTTTSATKPLSANQGYILDKKITDVNTYYNQVVTDITNEVNTKQELVIHKATSPPNDVTMIWYDTTT